jgi:hypothetical protein
MAFKFLFVFFYFVQVLGLLLENAGELLALEIFALTRNLKLVLVLRRVFVGLVVVALALNVHVLFYHVDFTEDILCRSVPSNATLVIHILFGGLCNRNSS